MSDEPFSIEMQVRFRDVDAMGHVNNAVYATYLEQARTLYAREVMGVGLERINSVLAQLEISYRRPILLEERVTVTLDVPELGESSVPMEYEIRADGEVVATASTVQVFVDDSGSARPIPERLRERIRSYEGL